jgi:TolA-binding protein
MLEAEKMSIDYLKSHPDTASMWTHLGFLKELIYCDDKQACECYKAAAELGYLEADYNIAVSYYKQKEYKLAEDYYKKMLENFPNDEETVTSLGMCHLTQKHFEEGYKYFYNRNCAANSMTNSLYKIGDKLKEDVIVICDQGFGDHIQFVRYLPILSQKS